MRFRRAFTRLPATISVFALACDRAPKNVSTTGPSTRGGVPTIASTVPSATSLILDIDGRNQLVGVASSGEVDRPEIANLPRVGDYQNNDWEKLAATRPTYLVTFYQAGREPAGLKQRADELGIALINVKIERLADVLAAYDFFGEKLGRAAEAAAAKRRLQATLDAVRQRVGDRSPVRTLLSLSDDGAFAAGPNTFIDDALQAAGGVNALDANSPAYPKLDREKIAAIKPEAIVILMPAASAQSKARALEFWKTMNDVPAVKAGRVAIIDDAWAIQPGPQLGQLADKMANAIHPESATTQAGGLGEGK